MGRRKRQWTSQNSGSFHIISRITGGRQILESKEKEYFMRLPERFASGFFVQIHSFTILDNHFHILATGLNMAAQRKSREKMDGACECFKVAEVKYGERYYSTRIVSCIFCRSSKSGRRPHPIGFVHDN